MKLPLRYFLLACLLLGAVGVPLGWKYFKARQVAEIERLEKELAALLANEPGSHRRRLIVTEGMRVSRDKEVSGIKMPANPSATLVGSERTKSMPGNARVVTARSTT